MPATTVNQFTRTPVGILGGMGPAAGADFARSFVQACIALMNERGIPVRDQNFPEHWLVQIPVPDRTAGLVSEWHGEQQPLEPMLQAIGRLHALGTKAIAIACNTAHAWHPTLQSRFPSLDILHVADEVARHLTASGIGSIGLLATEGTYLAGVYSASLERVGVACHIPDAAERSLVTRGIYDGVKAGRMDIAREAFQAAAESMVSRVPLQSLVLACTEIPLAMASKLSHSDVALVDPSSILARALAERAYGTPS